MMKNLSIKRCNDPSCWCRNPKWNGENEQRGISMGLRKLYLVKQEINRRRSNGNKETDVRK